MNRIVPAVLAAAFLVAACGGHGSAPRAYTRSDNPCVNSRLANGTWRQDATPKTIVLAGAETLCQDGAAFDSTSDSATGTGANTSGWDYPPSCSADTLPGCLNHSAPPGAAKRPHPGHRSASAADPGSASTTACPSPAQLQAAWNAAPASVRHSWAGAAVSGFEDISCWQQWIVADPVANGNGTAVFSRQNGLHLLPATKLQQFNSVVCSTPGSPASWKNPAAGPADCSS